MSVSIRKGFRVKENEIAKVNTLKKFESLGILQLSADKVQYCKCNAPHKLEGMFLHEGKFTCSCGRNIRVSKSASTEYTVNTIHYDKIVQICKVTLSEAVGKTNYSFDEKQRSWICNYNGKRIPVFISEISSYNQYVAEQSDSCWLCLVLDWAAFKGNLNYYNEIHFVRIEDILNETIRLPEELDLLTTQCNTNVSIELGEKFDTFVSSISWQQFERFAKRFLDEIKKKVVVLDQFISFLSARRNTIVNSKVVLLGGPANPDFVVIDLLDYLQHALKPGKFGEVKHYVDSELRLPKYGVSLIHAGTKSSTLCIVATNNVDPELWKFVLDTKKEVGYFKHIILERDTLVLLIRALGMEDLLSIEAKETTTS